VRLGRIKLKLTLFYFTGIKTVAGSLRQRRTRGQCEGEGECEGSKCPHTCVRLGRIKLTLTLFILLEFDSFRIIAPEAQHGGQCEGID
jgi:hypothetical protein